MRRLTPLLALALLAASCSFSSVRPDAQVTITGRALDAAGHPLPGAKVLLFKEADVGEVVFGSVLAIGSLGTVCLLPDAPALCARAEHATTDGDGRYAFEIVGADTQGTLGAESALDVVFADPSRTPSTTLSFHARGTSVRLPDARIWKADPRVTTSRHAFRLTWSRLSAGSGSERRYFAELFQRSREAAIWSEPADAVGAAIDARILEDQPGSVAAAASSVLPGGHDTGEVRTHYLSARLAVRPGAGGPPSRGRRCAVVTGTSPVAVGRFATCPATDGDLTTPAHLSGPGVVTGVAIDLGVRRPIRLIVVRGFAGQVIVEVSGDGHAYQAVATGSGSTIALRPSGSVSGRYVRVRSPSGVDQSLETEVSVW